MKRLIVTAIVAFGSVAWAQPGSGSGSNAGSGSGSGSAAPTPAPPVAAGSADPDAARKACTAAMNADPAFAEAMLKTAATNAEIAKTGHGPLDNEIVATHQKAADDVAMNEKHVIMAYAAMWILSVIFVVFLFTKQRGLKLEIATLKRDLEAALATQEPKA